ncbi:MAG: hypothetical protein PVJ80_07750 [Gemmatimonadota bacterium]|jgi:hypothetical protein
MVIQGVFERRDSLREAVNGLMARGVPTNTIRVYLVDSHGNRRRELPVDSGSGALRGALIGAGGGAIVGLAIAALLSIEISDAGATTPLGVGSFLGGLRVAALLAAAGVPLGGLLGMGHWQGAYRVSSSDLERFKALVVVETRSKADEARQVLDQSGAELVETVH